MLAGRDRGFNGLTGADVAHFKQYQDFMDNNDEGYNLDDETTTKIVLKTKEDREKLQLEEGYSTAVVTNDNSLGKKVGAVLGAPIDSKAGGTNVHMIVNGSMWSNTLNNPTAVCGTLWAIVLILTAAALMFLTVDEINPTTPTLAPTAAPTVAAEYIEYKPVKKSIRSTVIAEALPTQSFFTAMVFVVALGAILWFSHVLLLNNLCFCFLQDWSFVSAHVG